MAPFDPEHTLLNPLFEGYKLDAIIQEDVLSRHPLPHALNQSTAAAKSPLSFHEMQSRIRHNHIAISPTGFAVYVAADYKVVGIADADPVGTHLSSSHKDIIDLCSMQAGAGVQCPLRAAKAYSLECFRGCPTLGISIRDIR